MKPASYNFRFSQGGEINLAAILYGRNPKTSEVQRLPIPGVTIEWTVEWPGEAPEVRTQSSTPTPLTVDSRTGAIGFSLPAARKAQIAAASKPIPTRIRLVMSDGTGFPVLTGAITVEK